MQRYRSDKDNDVRDDLEEEEHENEELKAKIQECENEKQELKRVIEDLKTRVAELTRDFLKEKKEKDDALTRLSAVAGDKLRYNNPGIADLSDEYRPNKLAEKFSELYDNEWTEFYEDLERTGNDETTGNTEENIIGQLLQLLQEIYTTCKQLAENQRDALVNAIIHPGYSSLEKSNPPDGILIKVIDFQKRTVPWALDDVKKKIMEKHMENKSTAKRNYIKRCVHLCWMMGIQDPPMYLDFGPQKGSTADKNVYKMMSIEDPPMHLDFGPEKDSVIDKNVFKMFTKTGDALDFVVWPAVFLHYNGPLVQKGVLQPK
uniref:Uncharacterized protein LOC111123106 n=1 Tax=Crassostrea virginica TaxID=6565 RepID=A0A8B8D095_CRAVI|nr:uncharacterized protein LOC111123106 [Crassostrea virginica]